MDDSNLAPQSDRMAHRLNQIMSGLVACAVLGVGGVIAYQNRDALHVPDRNAAWGSFWTKKMSNKSGIPSFDAPEFKPTIDWEKNAIDPSLLRSPSFQFDPAQSSIGSRNLSSSGRRR